MDLDSEAGPRATKKSVSGKKVPREKLQIIDFECGESNPISAISFVNGRQSIFLREIFQRDF